MTFHNVAPDGLPYVDGGMIWDGATEYHDRPPPGVSTIFLLRMYGDGTRRFSEFKGTGEPMTRMRATAAVGWEKIGIIFTRPENFHINDGFLATTALGRSSPSTRPSTRTPSARTPPGTRST